MSLGLVVSELADLEISRESLTMVREMGRGEFGVVMEASAVNLQKAIKVQTVAVKMLKHGASESTAAGFVREAVRLRPLNHVNVVRLLGVCFQSSPPLIVLEFMQHGDLKTYLREARTNEHKHSVLGQAHFLKLAMDCTAGFRYLQEQQYVHRDLAARNVLLSRTFVAKIGDFGMSCVLWRVG